MSHESVEYRPIASYERYRIGSDGSVLGPAGNQLRPSRNTYGYRHVLLYGGGGRKDRKLRTVHQLVLEAFVGPKPGPGFQGAHWDGDLENNSVSNLRWTTAKENIGDKVRHGRVSRTRGEIDGMSKLTNDEVRRIRARCAAGERQRDVAADYEVSQPTISDIITGRSWSHLEQHS